MEQIEIKSNWLAFALGARNNKITLDELNNTRIIDFSLLEYLRGNSDIYFNEISNELSTDEVIFGTNIFMLELSKLQEYADFNIEHIELRGMNFKDSSLDILYSMIDLKKLILEGNNNCSIDLSKMINIQNMELILNECETKFVLLSDYTKYSMGLSYTPNEYELYRATRRNNFKNHNVDIEDLQTISRYTTIMPNICIKSIQDIKMINKMKLNNISVCLRTGYIKDIVELSQLVDHVNALISKQDKSISFNQVINDVSELSLEQLRAIQNKISKKANFNNVKILKYIGYYEQYSIDIYIKIRSKIDLLIHDIDVNLPDINKFLTIQDKIIYGITFDMKADNANIDNMYFKEHEITSRNLEDGLILEKCVCEGYADIFRNMLKCVNIDSTFVKGLTNSNIESAWNQVKIDYDWYNTDLCADRYGIIQEKELVYCLKSDAEFYKQNLHSLNFLDKSNVYLKKCDKSYNLNTINKLIQNNMHECRPKLIIDIVEEINHICKQKYSIIFKQENDNQYKIGLVENVENELLIQSTKIYIDKDNIGSFIKEYLNRYKSMYSIQNYEQIDLTHVFHKNGVGLILDSRIRQRLYQEGIVDLRTDIEKEKYNRIKDRPIDMIDNYKGKNV